MRSALVVFAKTPRPGASKTRLVPPLSPDDAAALSRCFIADIAATVALVASSAHATPCIAFDGERAVMRDVVGDAHVLLQQRGRCFGERLEHAAGDAFALGHDAVCLIGADSPTLPGSHLDAALEELARPGDRIVLGPALDGGYYLLGIKRVHHALFDDARIRWSTASVAAETIAISRELGIEPALLDPWYDVDDPSALAALLTDLAASDCGAAAATRAFLACRFDLRAEGAA